MNGTTTFETCTCQPDLGNVYISIITLFVLSGFKLLLHILWMERHYGIIQPRLSRLFRPSLPHTNEPIQKEAQPHDSDKEEKGLKYDLHSIEQSRLIKVLTHLPPFPIQPSAFFEEPSLACPTSEAVPHLDPQKSQAVTEQPQAQEQEQEQVQVFVPFSSLDKPPVVREVSEGVPIHPDDLSPVPLVRQSAHHAYVP